ncbi:hypothetical protein RHMOL_Rhmol06G0180500 [Rhododendron molle]|uniref:Uncharacterized protein n=1 Tax=Rhododendron molle TaxID=49168 RepID=A0ACC0NE51_RHOML|nr:hypothetical protein RHMOL_Rhmol06G0180500 [Rhododendron molle]
MIRFIWLAEGEIETPRPRASPYDEAMDALSSLITKRSRADKTNKGDRFNILYDYIKKLDLEEPISKMKVIHVAGTKGKEILPPTSDNIWKKLLNWLVDKGQVPILECQGISSRFRHFLKKAVTVAVGVAPQALAMIWVPTNLGGAERLALGIIESESDFYLHSLWGLPNENFNILLFHYDGWTNKLALLLDTFPFFFKERRCTDPHLPPCAAFVEIMAPVFSRDAWRCVWHMIQHLAAASPPLFSGNDCSFSCSTIPTVGRRKPQPFLAPPRSSIEMPWSIRYPASKGEKLDLEDGGERDLTDSWVTCGLSEEKTNLIDKVSWLDYGHRGMQVWYPSPGVDPFKQEDFLQLDPELKFDLEVYPLGLLPTAGVVGVSQRMSFSASTEFPCFEPSPQAQTLLHCLLRHLL